MTTKMLWGLIGLGYLWIILNFCKLFHELWLMGIFPFIRPSDWRTGIGTPLGRIPPESHGIELPEGGPDESNS